MYFIVETQDQLCQLSPIDTCFIQVIPSSDKYHPKLTRCSLIYYNNGTKGFIFSINHSEGFSLEIAQIQSFLSKHKNIYLFDRKFHSYYIDVSNCIDLNFIRLDQNIPNPECDTKLHNSFNSKYDTKYINEIIPIVKHYEKCERLSKIAENLMGLENDYSTLNKISDAYKWVEEQGIKVDKEKLIQAYKTKKIRYNVDNEMSYSYYNMYNFTGRPTNSFNFINYVAIPKTQEFRDAFIPENDFLVEFDFDSYHLRLIASEIQYSFHESDISIHEQFGKLYFNKTSLTEEEYSKSKEITFKQLYGGIQDEYSNIEFFKKLSQYIDNLYIIYRKQGSITLPTGKLLKRSDDVNKLKLFNYWIQNLETKCNFEKIFQIKEYIEKNKSKSKLILITYDAFLFDYSIEDDKQFLIDMKNILEGNNLKVKLKKGKTYLF